MAATKQEERMLSVVCSYYFSREKIAIFDILRGKDVILVSCNVNRTCQGGDQFNYHPKRAEKNATVDRTWGENLHVEGIEGGVSIY